MTNLFSLHGKVAIITGAASGIGAGIAAVLAGAGARVIIADHNAAGAEAEAARLREAGHMAEAMAVDLADEASVVSAVAAMVASHGAPWAVVNNAGLQDRQYLFDETTANWDRTHAVNARGVFLMMRECGKAMIAGSGGGRIINIASATVAGMIVRGGLSYTASKGAVLAMGPTAALEFAPHGITVNTVLPGAVITPGCIAASGPPTEGPATRRSPLGMSEPQDIGAAVLFFASPAARFVTAQVLAVDAGFSIS